MADHPTDDLPAGTGNGKITSQPSGPTAAADEQILSDGDQTLADTDQTLADTDQTGSDRDQTSSDCDQLASTAIRRPVIVILVTASTQLPMS